MMNIMHFYEAGKARSGRVLIPFFDTVNINTWHFSTKHGNAKVKWGDGNETDYVLTKNIDYTSGGTGTSMSHTYATPYTGDVEVIFKQGLSDVYSVNVIDGANGAQRNKINILDFGTYIKKFNNLYSYHIETYTYGNTANMSVIKGDLADIPASVERIKIGSFEILNNSTDVWFNFSSLPANSKLKFLDLSGEIGTGTRRKILGNLGNLPVGCSFVRINRADNSAITYTAGKVWASSFDTLSIPFGLTTAELDNLLIDMNNSISTKVGDGVISLGGYRSSLSDSAVASLQAKGFTVNVVRNPLNTNSFADSAILRLDLQNNFDVYSNSGLNIASGGNWNPPTFALSGRKPGEYCAVFNGSQSIKTTTNLPINSDKVTVAFWMKTTQAVNGVIAELSTNIGTDNAFTIFTSEPSAPFTNKLAVTDKIGTTSYNIGTSAVNVNTGAWFHVVAVIDRSLGTSQNKIYINGLLSYTQVTAYQANNNGNYGNYILYLGQRAGNSSGYNGSITRLKMTNTAFTAEESLSLFESESIDYFPTPAITEIIMVPSYGQSLAIGTQGGATTFTAPVDIAIDVNGVNSNVQDMNGGYVETFKTLAIANNITLPTGFKFMTAFAGVGGTAITNLSKGTAPYNNLLSKIQAGKNYANSIGKQFSVPAFCWTQGEEDMRAGGNNANYGSGIFNPLQYKTKLIQLVDDLNTDIKAITGQTTDVLCIMYQTASHNPYQRYPRIAMQQLEAAKQDVRIILAKTMYDIDYDADQVHAPNTTYRNIGNLYGAAIFDALVLGKKDKPIIPLTHWIDGSLIYVQFDVPVEPLAFDTTIVTALPDGNKGFNLLNVSGENTGTSGIISQSAILITNVEIFSNDTVKITLSGVPPSGTRLTYGINGTGWNQINGYVANANKSGRTLGARGQLRDSQNYYNASTSRNLYNFAPIFEIVL